MSMTMTNVMSSFQKPIINSPSDNMFKLKTTIYYELRP
jgi:hypothetical protein